MKVLIQESEVLADLASELWSLDDPDFPQFATLDLPVPVQKQLVKLLTFAMTTSPVDRLPVPHRAMVNRIRADRLLLRLLTTPWKSIHVVDSLGTLGLIY